MDKDKRTIDDDEDEESENNGYIFKHDESIERYLKNPDAIIAGFTGYRFILKVESGYITDSSLADVEKIITETAIDYEYPFLGMNITSDRIEIKIEVTVNEAPLESAERFQKRLERDGIITELLYIGTLGKEQSDQQAGGCWSIYQPNSKVILTPDTIFSRVIQISSFRTRSPKH